MVTYSEKHHWVFPLVPTDCAYTKLNDYFWKIKQEQIEVRGDFGDHSEVRKVTKSKSRKLQAKVGKCKSIISEMKM